ncbi:MAG: hypothetical protein ACXACI_12645 [Candidatus Hodarchaeales archaeon]
MNGTFPMPSLSNSIIVFASFYQIGSGLAIVAVVPPGTRKRGKPGPESNNLPWPIAERRVNRRSSQEFSLATGLIGVRGSSATRGYPGLRSEKTMKQVQPTVKRELPRGAGLRGLAGSPVL